MTTCLGPAAAILPAVLIETTAATENPGATITEPTSVLITWIAIGIFVGVLVGPLVGLMFGRVSLPSQQAHSSAMLRWSWRDAFRGTLLFGLSYVFAHFTFGARGELAPGLAVGLLNGVAFGLLNGVAFGLLGRLVGGPGSGLFVGLLTALLVAPEGGTLYGLLVAALGGLFGQPTLSFGSVATDVLALAAGGLTSGLFSGPLGGLLFGLSNVDLNRIRPIPGLRWSWRRAGRGLALFGLGGGLLGGMAGGVIAWLSSTPLNGQAAISSGLGYGVEAAFVLGLVGSFSSGLARREVDERDYRLPDEGIRLSEGVWKGYTLGSGATESRQ